MHTNEQFQEEKLRFDLHQNSSSWDVSDNETAFARKTRKRAVITAREAGEIFLMKYPRQEASSNVVAFGNSVEISQRYGISPKAVRDIWNR